RRHTRFSRDWSSDVCSSDLVQVPLLLLRCAEGGHREAGQRVDGHADRHRHPGVGDLLHDLEVHLVGLAAPAELLGVGERQQARLPQLPEHLPGEPRGPLGLVHLGEQDVPGDLADEADEVLGFLGGHDALHGHGLNPTQRRGQWPLWPSRPGPTSWSSQPVVSRRGRSPGSTTTNWPIIPWSSCSSWWQWYMYGVVGSAWSRNVSRIW